MGEICVNQTLMSASGTLLTPFPTPSLPTWVGLLNRQFPEDNCLLAEWDLIVVSRASLVAQWLRVCLPMQGTRVRALVWEDPTCRGTTKPVSHNC